MTPGQVLELLKQRGAITKDQAQEIEELMENATKDVAQAIADYGVLAREDVFFHMTCMESDNSNLQRRVFIPCLREYVIILKSASLFCLFLTRFPS